MIKHILSCMFFSIYTLVIAGQLPAAQTMIEGKKAVLGIVYNEKAAPGDAVVVRMNIKNADSKKPAAVGEAIAELFNGQKRVEKTVFFMLPKGRGQEEERIAYIPLSTWLNEGEYMLHITVRPRAQDEEEETAQLPVAILHKDFISETIPLNDRNTAIKTDTSDARMKQIKRLNAILGTVTQADVFSIKSFIPPVPKDTRRSSYFGDRRVYQYTSGKTSTAEHYGIDYAVPTGTVVASCADGKVVMAEDRVSTGWSVAIEHAPGLYSLYYHMSTLAVKEGQTVKTGEKLGLSGATGLATGPHLHWEVRLNMCAVSPDFWTGNYAFVGE